MFADCFIQLSIEIQISSMNFSSFLDMERIHPGPATIEGNLHKHYAAMKCSAFRHAAA